MPTRHDTWLSTAEFAPLAGTVPRNAHRILTNCLEGGRWRGVRLAVRKIVGAAGGGGVRYEVRLDSLPPEIQARWQTQPSPPAIVDRSTLPAVAATQQPPSELTVYQAITDLSERSPGRSSLVKAASKFWHKSENTIRRKVRAFEERGVVALHRAPRSDKGSRRVRISRAFDRLCKDHSIDDRTHDDIASKMERRTASLWAARYGWEKIAQRAARTLRQLVKEIRPAIDPDELAAGCILSRAYVERTYEFKKLAEHDHDAKEWDDKRRRSVTRRYDNLVPMQVVVGDVHPLDIPCRRADDTVAHARMITWFDLETHRVWATLKLCDAGTSVRGFDVTRSFVDLGCGDGENHEQWGLMSRLYFDRGSEYGWTEFIDDALKLAELGITAVPSTRDSNTIRALPYNARGKPCIEGFFAIFENNYLRQIPGHIGTDRMRPKKETLGKALPVFPGTFEELCRVVRLSLDDYNNTKQSGHLQGRSPYQQYERHCRAGWKMTVFEKREQLELCFATEGERRVQKGGEIQFDNIRYIDEDNELPLYVGKTLRTRKPIDPNCSFISVLLPDGRPLICHQKISFNYDDPAGRAWGMDQRRKLARHVKDMRSQVDKVDAIRELEETCAELPPPPTAAVGDVISISGERAAEAAALAKAKQQPTRPAPSSQVQRIMARIEREQAEKARNRG